MKQSTVSELHAHFYPVPALEQGGTQVLHQAAAELLLQDKIAHFS